MGLMEMRNLKLRSEIQAKMVDLKMNMNLDRDKNKEADMSGMKR